MEAETAPTFSCVLTSREHLARFYALEEQTPMWRKLFGLITLPRHFPRLSFPRVPLPFFAVGRLTRDGQTLTFEALPARQARLPVKNLLPAGYWTWTLGEFSLIRRYQIPDLNELSPRANLSWFALEDREPSALLLAAAAEFFERDAAAPAALLRFLEAWTESGEEDLPARANVMLSPHSLAAK